MTTPTYQQPIQILQDLIRMDTTNPPGNEILCIEYLDKLLQAAGIETTILAKDPNRPNLIARLKGDGSAPGLVLQGHVDVVTTANQEWDRDPFGGELVDGYLWGRGSLDMKGGVVMMLCAFLQAHAEGLTPAGDIVLAIVADEEAGSDFGARFLVEEHPEHFAGAKYAIGEGGGPRRYMGEQPYYSVMVAEKQVCWMKTRFHGPGGHGSQPLRNGAMAKLGHVLTTLNQNRLPVHIVPAMETVIHALAAVTSEPTRSQLLRLLDPTQTDAVLDALIALDIPQGRMFDPLLHNTVNATVVQGGFKTNVIPSEIELELDGRLLPGFTPAEMIGELKTLLGEEVAFDIIRHDPGTTEVDMALFPLFESIIADLDPGALTLPALVGGFTDGRMFARLGIQNYGFLPTQLPQGFDAFGTVHGANERVWVEGIEFGQRALHQVLRRYGRQA